MGIEVIALGISCLVVWSAKALFAPPPGGGLVLVTMQGRVPFRRRHIHESPGPARKLFFKTHGLIGVAFSFQLLGFIILRLKVDL